MRTVIVNVKPVVRKRLKVIGAVPNEITDGRVSCPVNVVVTPRVREHQNRGIRTLAGELFPVGLEVILKKMAEEASTRDLVDNRPKTMEEGFAKTTAMYLTMKDDVIVRQVLAEVLEETRADDTTIKECTYGILDKNESTKIWECPYALMTTDRSDKERFTLVMSTNALR